MAKCYMCGQDYDNVSLNCPYCGAEKRVEKHHFFRVYMIIILSAMLTASVLCGVTILKGTLQIRKQKRNIQNFEIQAQEYYDAHDWKGLSNYLSDTEYDIKYMFPMYNQINDTYFFADYARIYFERLTDQDNYSYSDVEARQTDIKRYTEKTLEYAVSVVMYTHKYNNEIVQYGNKEILDGFEKDAYAIIIDTCGFEEHEIDDMVNALSNRTDDTEWTNYKRRAVTYVMEQKKEQMKGTEK